MAPTTRKRSPGRETNQNKNKNQRNDAETQETNAPTPATETVPADPKAELTAAYWSAIESRDPATGTIPAEPIDAVKVAARRLDKRQRQDLALRLNAEANEKVMTETGVDAGLAVAIVTLSAAIAQVGAQPAAPPHDPVPGVAGFLSALEQVRGEILALLNDEQRERVDTVDVESDDAAKTAREQTLSTTSRIAARIVNGRKRRNGNGTNGERRPGRDLNQLVRDVVRKADGPVHLATICREHDVSSGALVKVWDRKVDGVKSVKDGDHKAFVAV